MTYHDHPHRDVNKWARVAREANAARLPAPAPVPRPAKRPAPYGEPTYGDRRAWQYALARPCDRHGADAGQPCWDGAIRGMCAARTRTLGHVAVSQRRGRGATTTTKEAS